MHAPLFHILWRLRKSISEKFGSATEFIKFCHCNFHRMRHVYSSGGCRENGGNIEQGNGNVGDQESWIFIINYCISYDIPRYSFIIIFPIIIIIVSSRDTFVYLDIFIIVSSVLFVQIRGRERRTRRGRSRNKLELLQFVSNISPIDTKEKKHRNKIEYIYIYSTINL